MKKISIIILIILANFCVNAQTEVDALRYSQMFYGGTARFVSMAGAFGALGADASTTSTNPAGIAVYNRSEFTFTPNLVFNNTQSDFLGNRFYDYRTNFNINNLAYIGSASTNSTSGLSAVNWGLTYNRLNNFHYNYNMAGNNELSSYSDVFAANANGYSKENLDLFREGLAWHTWVIDNVDSINYIYQSALPGYGEYQSRKLTHEGYMGEMDFDVGLNFSHKFYWGFTMGLVWTRYWETSYHYEQDNDGSIDNFNFFKYKEELLTTGSGINLKTGFIYKPVRFVRLGLAVHTPTWFTFDDTYFTKMSSSFDDVGESYSESPTLMQRYDMRSPARFIANFGFVIGKFAAIGIEYEYVNYSWAKYSTYNGFYPVYANNAIKDTYSGAHNVRIGGEYRLGFVSFRSGFAFYDSPFKDNLSNADSYTYQYTGGLGFNFNSYYIDLAYVRQINDINYYLYDPTIAPIDAAVLSSHSNKIMVTFGARF